MIGIGESTVMLLSADAEAQTFSSSVDCPRAVLLQMIRAAVMDAWCGVPLLISLSVGGKDFVLIPLLKVLREPSTLRLHYVLSDDHATW